MDGMPRRRSASSLGSRLIAGFLVIQILFALSATLTWLQLSKTEQSYSQALGRLAEASKQARTAEVAATEMGRLILAYMQSGDSKQQERYQNTKAGYDKAIAEVQSLVGEDELGRIYLIRVQVSQKVYDEVALPGLTIVAPTVADQKRIASSMDRPRKDLASAIRALVTYVDEQQAAMARQAQAEERLGFIYLGAGSAAALVVSLIVAQLIARSVSRGVRVASEAATRVATGDLSSQVKSMGGSRELQQLRDATQSMLEGLRELVTGVQEAATAVTETAGDLSGNARESALSAEQVAKAITDVAAGANTQSNAATLTRSHMRELEAALTEIADGVTQVGAQGTAAFRHLEDVVNVVEGAAAAAGRAASNAADAAARARDGSGVVTEAVSSIHRVGGTVGAVAQSIQRLDTLSARVGEITTAISQIAEQTSLLALNAAIEAARAGEHGRGFAIVAEEVRKLATGASSSADQIGRLVKDIRSETVAAVEAMNAGNAALSESTRLATDAGQALEGILAVMSHGATDLEAIASAVSTVRDGTNAATRSMESAVALMAQSGESVQAMIASSSQVASAGDQVAQVAEENAAACQEVSATAEELHAGTEHVAEAAEQLRTVALRLQELATRFRLS